MSYTYHGTTGLITLPGREVQTFPSGLVRITRTYVCRKGLEGQFRQLLAEGLILPNDDAAPCIDGAYIFPTPIENIRDDGFVEFRVTAYGRSKANPTFTSSLRAVEQGVLTYQQKTLSFSVVSDSTPLLSDIDIPEDAFDIVDAIYREDPLEAIVEITRSRYFTRYVLRFQSGLTLARIIRVRGFSGGGINVTSTNFGFFTEYTFALQ
jgi:hypothetical protein